MTKAILTQGHSYSIENADRRNVWITMKSSQDRDTLLSKLKAQKIFANPLDDGKSIMISLDSLIHYLLISMRF